MKARNFRVFSFIFVFACLQLIVIGRPAQPVFAKPDFRPDITVRISNIEEALETIEGFSQDDSNAQWSPRSMVQGFLKGTGWIDENRAMVFAMVLSEKSAGIEPEMAVLVPFSKPNQEFANAYAAVEKDDYYLIALPPGQGKNVGQSLESALLQNADEPQQRFLTVDIAAARALEKAEADIEEMILSARQAVEQQQQSARPDNGAKTPDPDQTEEMIRAFVALFQQVETFSTGMDLNRNQTTFFSELTAAGDTELQGVISGAMEQDAPLFLANMEFSDNLGMRFRSRPFDFAATTAFTEKYFGEIYRTMGIDLQDAQSVVEPFTGETAGAMAIEPSGLILETVSCIKADRDLSVEYLESEYIPWILEAGEGMAEMYEKQYPDLALAPVFVKTEETSVADTPVVGVKGRMPIIREAGDEVKIFVIPLRMAVKDRYLLAASDDEKLAGLIGQVADLEPATVSSDRALMEMTIDWAGLMRAGIAMAPEEVEFSDKQIPDLGRLAYTLKLRNGRIRSHYAIKTDDIKEFVAFLSSIKPMESNPAGKPASSSNRQKAKPEPSPGQTASASAADLTPADDGNKSRKSEDKQKETDKNQLSKDEPAYWTEKGGLYLAYGNSDAAVEHFEKALELDAGNAGAHYNLALAYAENRSYEKAMEAIDQAVSMEPENGRYLHAKGWILVQTGNLEKGLAEIEKAAEKGNPDAVRYMNKIAPRHSGKNSR